LFVLITIGILAVIIIWEGKRCQTAYEQCASTNSANPQYSGSDFDFTFSRRADDPQKQPNPQIKTDNSCYRSNDYLCRMFIPANIPNVFLVLIGFGGIIVAIGTLDIIERQTKAIEDSVALQKLLNRQWLVLENWHIQGEKTQIGDRTLITLTFNVLNPTDRELELKHVEIMLLTGNQILTPNLPLAPTKSYSAVFHIKLLKKETEAYFRNSLHLYIMGMLRFKDNLGDRVERIFGEYCDGGVDGFEFRPFDRWLGEEDEN